MFIQVVSRRATGVFWRIYELLDGCYIDVAGRPIAEPPSGIPLRVVGFFDTGFMDVVNWGATESVTDVG